MVLVSHCVKQAQLLNMMGKPLKGQILKSSRLNQTEIIGRIVLILIFFYSCENINIEKKNFTDGFFLTYKLYNLVAKWYCEMKSMRTG